MYQYDIPSGEKDLNKYFTFSYNGPCLQKPNFPIAVEGGPKNIEYTKLVNFLTNEIRTLSGIDEEVNEISTPEDSVSFIMEVTSFLKELSVLLVLNHTQTVLLINLFFRLSL